MKIIRVSKCGECGWIYERLTINGSLGYRCAHPEGPKTEIDHTTLHPDCPLEDEGGKVCKWIVYKGKLTRIGCKDWNFETYRYCPACGNEIEVEVKDEG